jgi:uncharacterized protein (DUF2235 family)
MSLAHGDYGFGFSRGSFLVRVVVDLWVEKRGDLSPFIARHRRARRYSVWSAPNAIAPAR